MDLLRFKFIYCLYNLLHPGKLQHNVKWYRKYRLKKHYFSSVSSKDFAHLNANPNWLDQKDSATQLPKSDKFNELDPADQNAMLNWSTGGYAVLKGFFNGVWLRLRTLSFLICSYSSPTVKKMGVHRGEAASRTPVSLYWALKYQQKKVCFSCFLVCQYKHITKST